MYVNPHFAEHEPTVLHDLIAAHPFGVLVAPGPPPLAAHIPFVLHREDEQLGTLVAHTARADPIHAALAGGDELLAIFTGSAAYVRSRWYHEPGLPTYNFIAVHAHGRPRPISGRKAVLAHLSELVDVHERDAPDPFRLAEAPADYVAPLLEHIVPFTLPIDRLEGKVKLSQNRSAADRDGVIVGLRERGGDQDQRVASAMERHPYAHDEGRPLLGG